MTGGNMRPSQPLYSISKQPNWRPTSWPHTTLARQGQVAHKGGAALRHWDAGSDFPQQLFFDYWAVCAHLKSASGAWKSFVPLRDLYLFKEVAFIQTKWLTHNQNKIFTGPSWFAASIGFWRASRDGNGSVHHFGPDWNTSTTTGWIAIKFCTDSWSPQRVNPSDFGDPLTGWMDCLEIWTFMSSSGWILGLPSLFKMLGSLILRFMTRYLQNCGLDIPISSALDIFCVSCEWANVIMLTS